MTALKDKLVYTASLIESIANNLRPNIYISINANRLYTDRDSRIGFRQRFLTKKK